MTPPEFDAFLDRSINEYARERVLAGFWSQQESLGRSRKEHRALLRNGLKTRYHHLYAIQDAETGQSVGVLWFMTDMDSSRGTGHIFDIEIHEPFRQQGYGRAAMQELEKVARGMGLHQLGLHVFAHNEKAQALYRSLGYRVASLNLLKEL